MCEHYGHFDNRYVQRCVYHECWKYIKTEGDMDQLYNLEEDPYELANLAQEEKYQETRRKMKAILKDQIQNYRDSEHILGYGAGKKC